MAHAGARVLVDTSVWVAHFRSNNPTLQILLEDDGVWMHPMVLLELACGTPPQPRVQTLAYLAELQSCTLATSTEVMGLIEREHLYGKGCGAIDLQLLASCLITPNARIWTLDQDLKALSERFRVQFAPVLH